MLTEAWHSVGYNMVIHGGGRGQACSSKEHVESTLGSVGHVKVGTVCVCVFWGGGTPLITRIFGTHACCQPESVGGMWLVTGVWPTVRDICKVL